MEITSTKHNPMVSPHLDVWGWDVALYLFFSGLAAGVLIIAAIQYLYYGERKMSPMARYAVIAASIIVPLAMLGLLHDLANKANILAFYEYWNFTSTMAVGARALLIIPPVGLLFGLTLINEGLSERWGRLKVLGSWLKKYEPILARLTLVCGLFLGTYTGILLSANFGRPLWNTALLPVLFLVSGLSTGAAAMTLLSKDEAERTLLTKLDINLIVAEMGLLFLMLLSFALTTRAQHDALSLFLGGGFTASFWVFIVGAGLVAPLFLEQLQIRGKVMETVVPSIMVLIGGLALRVIIVMAGQASMIPN